MFLPSVYPRSRKPCLNASKCGWFREPIKRIPMRGTLLYCCAPAKWVLAKIKLISRRTVFMLSDLYLCWIQLVQKVFRLAEISQCNPLLLVCVGVFREVDEVVRVHVGIRRPALSGHIDASAKVVPRGRS